MEACGASRIRMASMLRYDTNDPVTRIGYIIADVFLVAFAACMLWGLFLMRFIG